MKESGELPKPSPPRGVLKEFVTTGRVNWRAVNKNAKRRLARNKTCKVLVLASLLEEVSTITRRRVLAAEVVNAALRAYLPKLREGFAALDAEDEENSRQAASLRRA